MRKRLFTTLLATLAVSGCGGEGARLELTVASDDPEVIRRTQAVLYYRLSEATRNPFANLATGYFPETGKLVFEYDRSAPDAASLEYLYSTRGDVRFWSTGANGEELQWIDNGDIETAESSKGDVFLAFRYDSLERIDEVSSANLGATLKSELDGERLQEVVIGYPIGRYFEVDVEDEATARNMAIVLRSGPLPVAVSEYAAP